MPISPREGVEVITKPTDIKVTDGDIRRYSRFVGPQRALNKIYGEGKWGDAEVKKYIQETKFQKFEKQFEGLEGTGVQARLEGYLESFEAPTPNDLEMLKAMCHIEVSLESVREKLLKADKPAEINNLTQSQTRLLTEHRQLQGLLGIDKVGRERGKKAKGALEEIQDLVEEGARFIEEQLVKISHCGILIGWIHPHFPETGYEFKTKCPRCGEEVQISVREASDVEI